MATPDDELREHCNVLRIPPKAAFSFAAGLPASASEDLDWEQRQLQVDFHEEALARLTIISELLSERPVDFSRHASCSLDTSSTLHGPVLIEVCFLRSTDYIFKARNPGTVNFVLAFSNPARKLCFHQSVDQ